MQLTRIERPAKEATKRTRSFNRVRFNHKGTVKHKGYRESSRIGRHGQSPLFTHQAVVHRDAETTKLRIVYDASSKERKDWTSLNDCLHMGLSLNPLLLEILVRFRENKIALVGDIEKAFSNITVNSVDWDNLRYLWVDNVRDNNPSVVVYKFCRIVFD